MVGHGRGRVFLVNRETVPGPTESNYSLERDWCAGQRMICFEGKGFDKNAKMPALELNPVHMLRQDRCR